MHGETRFLMMCNAIINININDMDSESKWYE